MTTDDNYPTVKAPKADRRRKAYRKRVEKHLEMLRQPPGQRWSFR
jgi:hypothetical protein